MPRESPQSTYLALGRYGALGFEFAGAVLAAATLTATLARRRGY